MAYGTVNADVIGTSVTGSNLGAGNASIMKNRIINGACVIDQRNAGASVTPVNLGYSLDRWNWSLSQASKVTTQQNAGSVTPPVGFSNYLGVTSSSAYSVLSSDYFSVGQAIEAFNTSDLEWGTANAKTVTLSFWVRSSLTGTFGGSLRTYNGYNTSYPFSYSIPVANTWTQISITVVGPTTGTWNNTGNSGSIYVAFSVGAGSSLSATAGSWQTGNFVSATGAVSVVGTSGATFYITGVQLEVGSSATGFEYRQYQQELALCQRYAQVFTALNGGFAMGSANSVAQLRVVMPLVETMRASPTATYTANTTFASGFRACSSISTLAADAGSLLIGFVPTVNYTVADADYLQIIGAGQIIVSAEL